MDAAWPSVSLHSLSSSQNFLYYTSPFSPPIRTLIPVVPLSPVSSLSGHIIHLIPLSLIAFSFSIKNSPVRL